MSGEIFFTVPFKYDIHLFCEGNKIKSTITNLQSKIAKFCPVLNISLKDFLRIASCPLSFCSKVFIYCKKSEHIIFLEGLKGGGIRASKSKVIHNKNVFEGNITQISNNVPLGQNTFNEIITNKELSGDSTQNKSMPLDFQLYTEENTKNTEKYLTQASLDRLQGLYYKQIGKFKEAKMSFLESYSVRKNFCKPGDEQLTQILLDLAEFFYDEGVSYSKSLEYYTDCLNNCKLDNEINERLVETINMGLMKVYAKLKNCEQVAECYELFQKIAPEYDTEKLIYEYLQIGLDLIEVDPKSSQWYLLRVNSMLDSVPYFKKKTELFKGLGDIHFGSKKYKDSVSFYEKALESDKKEKNIDNIVAVFIYKQLGNAYKQLGDGKKSVEMNELAVNLALKQNQENEEMVETLTNMGIQYYKNLETEKSIESFKKAIAINSKIKNIKKNSLIAYKHLARALFTSKEYSEAKENFLVLLEIYKLEPQINKYLIGDCIANLGLCCSKLEQFQESKNYFVEFFSIPSWEEERKNIEIDYFEYATVLLKLERFNESGTFFAKAAERTSIKKNTDYFFLEQCYKNAEISFDRGKNYQQALKHALSCLKVLMNHFSYEQAKIESLKLNIEEYKRKSN